MVKQNKTVENTEQNSNNLEISDTQYNSISLGIKIFYVLIAILIIFILEALINQYPIFEFLQYAMFKPESTILSSIALGVIFLGFLVLEVAMMNLMLTNLTFTTNIYFLYLVAIISIVSSFIILYESYNWEFGYLRYIAYLLLVIGASEGVIT